MAPCGGFRGTEVCPILKSPFPGLRTCPSKDRGRSVAGIWEIGAGPRRVGVTGLLVWEMTLEHVFSGQRRALAHAMYTTTPGDAPCTSA